MSVICLPPGALFFETTSKSSSREISLPVREGSTPPSRFLVLPSDGFSDSLYEEVTILSCPQASGVSNGKPRAGPPPRE